MRLHRFFVNQHLKNTGTVHIESDELVHQWRNVLRFQVGQDVILFDNSGTEFHGVLTTLNNRSAEVEIISSNSANFSFKQKLFLYLSLPKRDSFEWTLEKGTELGVMAFVPVISERSEKKKINIERSKNILKESSEQSGRVIVPEIFEPVVLLAALEDLEKNSSSPIHETSFTLDPEGEPFDFKKYKIIENQKSEPNRLNVFIGPEGGFSPNEITLFKKFGVPVLSLGKQVLRAETAAVSIASVLLLEF